MKATVLLITLLLSNVCFAKSIYSWNSAKKFYCLYFEQELNMYRRFRLCKAIIGDQPRCWLEKNEDQGDHFITVEIYQNCTLFNREENIRKKMLKEK